jgi:hypothetical protein
MREKKAWNSLSEDPYFENFCDFLPFLVVFNPFMPFFLNIR